MIVRPNSITLVALTLLTLYMAVYLHPRTDWAENTPVTRAFVRVLYVLAILFGGESLLSLGVPAVAGVYYLRNTFAMLGFISFIQFLAELPPAHTNKKTIGRVNLVMLTMLFSEFIFIAFRLARYFQSGIVPVRPFILQIPLLITMVVGMVTIIGKLIVSEREANQQNSTPKNIRQMLLTPQTQTGKMVRGLLFSVGISFIIFSIFTANAVVGYSILNLFLIDFLLIILITSIIFICLQFQPVLISLEFRIIGVSLAIYLTLASGLGWVLSLAFLIQTGLDAQLATPQELTNAFIENQSTVPQQLSQILLPVLGFEIISSILFVIGFTLLFRFSVRDRIQAILRALDLIQSGDFSQQIPIKRQSAEIERIATAINEMSVSLEASQTLMLNYQTELENEVTERTNALERETEQRKLIELKQAIQEERRRIARETHDGAIQSLNAIRYQLQSAESLSKQESDKIEAQLKQMANETAYAIRELRQLINDLNLELLDNGLTEAIYYVVNRLKRTYDVEVFCQLPEEEIALPGDNLLDVLRIVQEASTNACEHGAAKKLWITVCKELNDASNLFKIEIRDNGRGFEHSHASDGWGLRNMQRRAHRLGSELIIESEIGKGTTLMFHLATPMSNYTK